MPVDSMGRELIELVQIDQDFCNNTYGVAPCTATTANPSTKCFNTYFTCQDRPNYDRGTKTITLSKDVVHGAPDDVYSIPSLGAFKVSLPEFNIGARDTRTKVLGKFGSCSATFKDLPFSDNHLDPYVSERDYNPLENGTFWTKFLSRNPYYNDWKIRLYDGFVGQTIAQMNVREYRIDKITNPNSSGSVTITALDLMRKTDSDKALFPPASDCKLYTEVLSGDESIRTIGRLTPYTNDTILTKYLVISDTSRREIQTEVDNGDGTWTYTFFGGMQPYEVGASVSNAVYITSSSLTLTAATAFQVVLLLLRQVFTLSEIDVTQIGGEFALRQGVESIYMQRFILKPTPVNELLSDLAKDILLGVYYDEESKLIKARLAGDETLPVLTFDQFNNLIQGSTIPALDSASRASDILIHFNKSASDLDNNAYLNTLLKVDPTASSENEYNEAVTYEFNANWTQYLNRASKTATDLLTMYRSPTRLISFQLDIKDNIDIAQVFKLAYRGFTDIYGQPELINWICTGRTRSGDILQITAQEFKFNVPV